MSYARYDQYLYPYYKKDVIDGTLSSDFAKELMACCWIKTTEIIKLRDSFDSQGFAGYPMWQNIIVGGVKPDGTDGTNELSYAVLQSWDLVKTTQPSLSLRYHDHTPASLLREAMKLTQKGYATPAFFNDKLIIPLVLTKGATIEEARDYSFHGCVECYVTGCSDGRPVVGYVNMAKCLELALNNGYDPVSHQQLGPKTGDPAQFQNIEDVMKAHEAQIAYFIKRMTDGYTIVGAMHAKYLPKIFGSCIVGGAIEKGMSVEAGGAKYSSSGGFLVALANAADSLAAIEKVVFQDQTLTLPALNDILHKNFEGNERVRQILLNKAPKYGNDNPERGQIRKKDCNEIYRGTQKIQG